MKDKLLIITTALIAATIATTSVPAQADESNLNGLTIEAVHKESGKEATRGAKANTPTTEQGSNDNGSGENANNETPEVTVEAWVRVPVVIDRPADADTEWHIEIIDTITGTTVYANSGMLNEQGKTVTQYGDIGIFYAEWDFSIPESTMETPRPLEVRAVIGGTPVEATWYDWNDEEYYYYDYDASADELPLYLMYNTVQVVA